MAQLTHIRQRIRAVETIKKITHAMRLISMSTHSKLNKQKVHFNTYKQAFVDLYNKLIKSPKNSTPSTAKTLYILVASQKGLCGNFNSQLFKYFEKVNVYNENADFVTVGKYAYDYLRPNYYNLLKSYNKFSSINFVEIANNIADIIFSGSYTKIIFYSNKSKSFFLKESKTTKLEIQNYSESDIDTGDYIIETSKSELVASIRRNMLVVSIEEVLFDSLLCEQSSRFLSMDTATRNASSLLEEMVRDYNKQRQAAITQELSELVSSY